MAKLPAGGVNTPTTITPNAGQITVVHTSRTMRAYNFTDSDLSLITVTNVVSGFAFAVGTGIATFCLDLKKDLMLIDRETTETIALDFSVNWFGLPIAAALFLIGIVALIVRGSTISRVKRESQQA